MPAGPTTVAIVPHTHWDREWYAPFQTFRVRLVGLLDQLLEILERDASYARFLLDGQTAVLDDYLDIRPEAADTLRRLTASGRVSVGPWMILMDEFMVSGETIVRNLQLGVRRAAELGGAMPVGYLPDMFGHIAQMPQILHLAGLEHAVVWRGVPAAIDKTAFWWEAPDGSRVRAEYLYGSYSNGRDLPDDAKQLVGRAHGYELELGPARLPGGGILLMNGNDHQLPQPWLGRVVAEANEQQDDYRFVVTSLAEFLAEQPVDGLATWPGELRSGARANVLMGVASNRVDVHQACSLAERAIERRAEPLCTLLLPADEYPGALLDVAWKQLVLNSAHDSSCACSADEVVDQVLVRYAEARQIGDALTRLAIRRLAAGIDAPPSSTIVVNPTQHERSGPVQGYVRGDGAVHMVRADGTPCCTQVLRVVRGEGFSTLVTGQKVRWVLDLMRGPEFAGEQIAGYEMTTADDGTVDLVFRAGGPGDATIDLQELRDQLLELAAHDTTFRFRVLLAPTTEVVFAARGVPGFGWDTYTVASGPGPSSAVRANGHALANEHLVVAVDPTDGTFSVRTTDGLELRGCNRYVDGGDGGDTYNYSPPARDVVVDRPESVAVSVLDAGPVRARLLVESTYRWPTHAIGDFMSCSERSADVAAVTVQTTLELRADEQFLRIHTELDNVCRDHRLRAHFPLPATVDGSDAECAYTVVHRALTAEGGPQEAGLPTFVSRRFVSVSDGTAGLALLHDGLLEYEVVGGGAALALTLLRATGYLSRADLALRQSPAGPLDQLAGPQLLGRHAVDYALLPHHGDWRNAGCHARADEFLLPLERVRGGAHAGASRAATGQELSVDGATVAALHRDDTGPVLRIFNPSPEPATANIESEGVPVTGFAVDLRGRRLGPIAGSVPLGPWEIATLRLD